jgi:hypothetical protein
MTSTLKTELRAFSNLKGFVPTGTLKSDGVEGSKHVGEKGRVSALNWNSVIGMAYRLT